jgi:hypothetical protein
MDAETMKKALDKLERRKDLIDGIAYNSDMEFWEISVPTGRGERKMTVHIPWRMVTALMEDKKRKYEFWLDDNGVDYEGK